MHVEKGKYYRDGNGRVIGPLMFTGDGEFLHLVAEVYVSDTPPAERDALKVENKKLRAALQSVLNACDQGRMLERGAGGMTIDAQISRSFYYGVPAWPIEEARAALGEKG
jgi:hypothetical protein